MRRGLAPSREGAQSDIAAGRVLVGGAPATKAARLVDPGEPVRVLGPPRRFVSRGGEKLDAALDHFGIDVAGKRALDAGASTGGFTDCLLQRGAAHVIAVDVGHGQLDAGLRQDHRVEVHERTDIRAFTTSVPVTVADLSFISLRLVAPKLVEVTTPGGDLVVLIKPQFEAGRVAASRGKGVIRDPEVQVAAVRNVCAAFGAAGATIMGQMVSPLLGPAGNTEFLVHVRRGAGAGLDG